MNKKYLVIANTFTGSYGAEFTLFGIFDTEEEAIKFIMEHQTISLGKEFVGCDYNGDEIYGEHIFNFFEYYKPTKFDNTKENYARRRYIKVFDNNPICVGGYEE